MKAVVVYESMYGNTAAIAEAIASGLGSADLSPDIAVTAVQDVRQGFADGIDLLVVGGPTQVHGMSRLSTRSAALKDAARPGSQLVLDPKADGLGIRDWLTALGRHTGLAVAFDTRLKGPSVLTGRASKGIGNLLRSRGFTIIAEPESFLVTKTNELYAGELDRATDWGVALAARVAGQPRVPPGRTTSDRAHRDR